MIPFILHGVVLALLAFTFGAVLKVSDLLQDDGFRWFRGGLVACGAICAALILVLLALADVTLRIFWLAVVLHWILRARIDGVNHGIFATAVLVYLLFIAPLPLEARALEFTYFFALLAALGLLHDLFQYTATPAPVWIRWFFANQHLYWYMIGLGYLLLFERNFVFLAALYAFVKGYGVFYVKERYPWLERFGIHKPPSRPTPPTSDALA